VVVISKSRLVILINWTEASGQIYTMSKFRPGIFGGVIQLINRFEQTIIPELKNDPMTLDLWKRILRKEDER